MGIDIYAPTQSDTLSREELALYELIMDYRDELGLARIPLSESLTLVAGRHALDTRFNIWEAGLQLPAGTNLHSWSDAPYFADHSQPAVMWDAPERLGTAYTGAGFEISAAGYQTNEAALEGWKTSPGHNNVIANLGPWASSTWNAIGVGVVQEDSYDASLPYGGFVYHVWFGREVDPSGKPTVEGSLVATNAAEFLLFLPGEDLTVADAGDILADTLRDFSVENAIIFEGASFARSNIAFNAADGDLALDADADGTMDGTVRFVGDFGGGDFMVVATGGQTILTFETYLPSLAEEVTVARDLVNGINNQAFLTGDGATGFRVTLDTIAKAGMDNALGVYEIDASGQILDTRILVADVKSGSPMTVDIADVEAGHRLGFFIVQDGADVMSSLSDADTFSFIDTADGSAAQVADGAAVALAVNGVDKGLTVFHSFSETLNDDGVVHALSGVTPGGLSVTIGFEDRTGGGDRDYQDVVFDVEAFALFA